MVFVAVSRTGILDNYKAKSISEETNFLLKPYKNIVVIVLLLTTVFCNGNGS